eukprot:8553500-Alexandrium_andersonii.AAC.1
MAVLFADQSKAFERLGHAWLGEVLARWGPPAWLAEPLLELATRRTVVSPKEGGLGPPRRVLRS